MCTCRAQRGRPLRQCFDFLGERGGARTHDPLIKSQVLYRLSYALAQEAAD